MRNVENLVTRTYFFKNDSKNLYREIGKEKVIVNKTFAINDIERFWDTIWI